MRRIANKQHSPSSTAVAFSCDSIDVPMAQAKQLNLEVRDL